MSEETKVDKEQLAKNLKIREAARAKAEAAKIKKGFKKAHTGFANTIEWEMHGQFFEGVYRKVKKDVGTYGSMIYILEFEDHFYALWGSTQIDQAFSDIPLGSEVSITYLGDENIEGTKKNVKIFDVLYKEPKYTDGQDDNTKISYQENRASKRVVI